MEQLEPAVDKEGAGDATADAAKEGDDEQPHVGGDDPPPPPPPPPQEDAVEADTHDGEQPAPPDDAVEDNAVERDAEQPQGAEAEAEEVKAEDHGEKATEHVQEETGEGEPTGDATKEAEPAGDATEEAEPTGDATKEAEPAGDATEEAEPAGDATEEAEPAGDATKEAEPAGDATKEAEPTGDATKEAADTGAAGDVDAREEPREGDQETNGEVAESPAEDGKEVSAVEEDAAEKGNAEEGDVQEGDVQEGDVQDGDVQEVVDDADTEPSEPVEFQMRQTAGFEFSLDPTLDENELQFELEDDVTEGEQRDNVSMVSRLTGAGYGGGGAGDDADGDGGSVVVVQSAMERERYADLHQQLSAERTALTRRNAVLQKKLMEHFKKRKMTDVFADHGVEPTEEEEERYLKRLNSLGELRTSHEADSSAASARIASLVHEEEVQSRKHAELLDKLLTAERDASEGLIDAKTGKPISEKLVDRLLKRQKELVYDLGESRLNFIRLKEKVAAKEAAIKDLEKLGEGLSMVDYEQLRMENQNLSDKVEERDEDLARMRARALHCMQALTHYKEKMHMVVSKLDQETARLGDLNRELDAARSELSKLKGARDRLRADLVRETTEAGLLTKPMLLRDFEQTQDARDELRAQLRTLREVCAAEKEQLARVREAGRGVTVEVEMKPKKRLNFVDTVTQRLERSRRNRGMGTVVVKSVTMEGCSEEFFQMK